MREVELPASWAKVSIGEAAAVNAKAFSVSPYARALPVHFIGMSSVVEEFGGVDVSLHRPLSEVQKGYTACLEGDVLFAKITPCMENGKVALVPQLQSHIAFGSTEFHVLRSRSGISPSWLAHYVSQPDFRRLARQNMTGSAGQLRVPTGWLAQALIPAPSLAEQTRIIAKLEELLSELDVGVAELKAAQKKLKQYRQSLLKAAVDGSLTAAWRARPANQNPAETGAQLLARILKERRVRWEAQQLARFEAQGKNPPKDWREKYSEPVVPDTSGLPVLPPGWVWASAEQLCEFITKGTTPPKELDGSKKKSVPFLRVTNLTDRGDLDLADEVFVSAETHQSFLARSVVYPNDVLMNIVGPPLGQVAVVPNQFPEWNVNQAIAIFRAVPGVSSGFICQYLLSPVAQHWLKGRAKTTAGQTNLTLEVCRSLPIALPPQAEQLALVVELDTAMKATQEAWCAAEQGLGQATAQRQNILRAAFAGQLVPQDPADEPASALLARIRAERDAASAAPKRASRRREQAATTP